MPSFIKIHPRIPEISTILCQKTCEIDWILFTFLFNIIFSQPHRFSDTKLKISLVSVDGFWWIMAAILPQNFWNFTAKFGSKVEIRWKLRKFGWIKIDFSWITRKSYVTFLKGYDASYQMTTKNLINKHSVKKIVEISV